MKSTKKVEKKSYTTPDLKQLNFFHEFLLTLSDKKSLFSSKKIERFVVFNVFLIITVIYIFKNLQKIEPAELIEVVGIWLAYGGYNTMMNLRDKKMMYENNDNPVDETVEPVVDPKPDSSDPK